MKVNSKQLINVLSRIGKDSPKRQGVIVTDENGQWLFFDVCDDNWDWTRYTLVGSGKDEGVRSCRVMEHKKLLTWLKAVKPACQENIDVEIEPDAKVTYSIRNKSLTVKAFGAVQDYPQAPNLRMPPFEKCILSGMSFTDFAKWGKILLASASNDTTRPYLCGVGFRKDVLMSTDGHRLSLLNLDKIGVHGIESDDDALLIPASGFERMVEEAAALKDGTVNIWLSSLEVKDCSPERYVMASFGNATRYVKLSDATPPPYDFLTTMKHEITFTPNDVSDIAGTLNEITSIMNPTHRHFPSFSICDGGLRASYEEDDASYSDTIQGSWSKPEDVVEFTIGFKPRYLLDALASFEKPTLAFSDPLSATLIHEEDSPYRHYVMPTRN
jgi:DNA polymerase III sliding clamp (beta) subunit (PCNA family)